jgi:hypothetical protein
MQAFVRFLGFAAAIVAAVLGLVWVMEAAPPSQQAIANAEIACWRTRGYTANCEIPRGWNEALVLRGLVALAVAAALAMMAARLPAPAGNAAEAEREAEALRVLTEDEKRRARLHQGNPISHVEAEIRARRRLRGDG